MGKYLVIDADVFLYRFAYANQFKVHWDDTLSSEVLMPFEMARDEMEDMIVKILRAVDCDDYILALSHPKDFRFRVDPTYQANRRDKESPVHKEPLREYIQAEHPWVMHDWLEGDDVLGLMATEQPERVVIATIDKDLKQIPGPFYNWNTGDFVTIPEDEARHFFWTQVLMGDPTDGVKGIPRVGIKKAASILEGMMGADDSDYWDVVLSAYEEKGLTEEYAIQQTRLIRILRKGEYDYERRRPILWKPPVLKGE